MVKCSDKTRFKDKLSAEKTIHYVKGIDDGRNKPSRAYYCSQCRGYHLTKNEMFSDGTNFHLNHIKDWKKLLKDK